MLFTTDDYMSSLMKDGNRPSREPGDVKPDHCNPGEEDDQCHLKICIRVNKSRRAEYRNQRDCQLKTLSPWQNSNTGKLQEEYDVLFQGVEGCHQGEYTAKLGVYRTFVTESA